MKITWVGRGRAFYFPAYLAVADFQRHGAHACTQRAAALWKWFDIIVNPSSALCHRGCSRCCAWLLFCLSGCCCGPRTGCSLERHRRSQSDHRRGAAGGRPVQPQAARRRPRRPPGCHAPPAATIATAACPPGRERRSLPPLGGRRREGQRHIARPSRVAAVPPTSTAHSHLPPAPCVSSCLPVADSLLVIGGQSSWVSKGPEGVVIKPALRNALACSDAPLEHPLHRGAVSAHSLAGPQVRQLCPRPSHARSMQVRQVASQRLVLALGFGFALPRPRSAAPAA